MTDPVVIEGVAETVSDGMTLARAIELINRKYWTDFPVESRCAFGLVQEDFAGSPPCWSVDPRPRSSTGSTRRVEEWRPGRLTADQADEGATDNVTDGQAKCKAHLEVLPL